jgi:hypothetical protein
MRSLTRRYASPWPDEIPGLGLRAVGPFDACAGCEGWSWVRYGATVLCLACADRAEKDRLGARLSVVAPQVPR